MEGNDCSLTGKVAIITGSTSGIGLQTAKDLRLMGASIIIPCRDEVRGRAAVEELQSMEGCPGEVQMFSLDLMCYQSILEFCSEIREQFPKIDILVCNAGVMGKPFELSSDGIESHFATNLFGHHVMINNLVEKLDKNEGRILLVSSGLYKSATVIPSMKQLMGEDNWDYDSRFAYSFSKLAMNLYSTVLASKIEKVSSNIKVICIRPGFVRGTELGRETHWLLRKIAAPIIWLVSKNLQDGSRSLVKACTSSIDSLESGMMYHDGDRESYNEMITQQNASSIYQMIYNMEMLVIKRSKLPKNILEEASIYASLFVS